MKRLALVAGLLLLALIWGGPLLSSWRDSFAAHMLAHMGVVAVAAPLIAIGLAGIRFVPQDRQDNVALWSSLPVIASLVDLVVVWGWHAPALRALAEGSLLAAVLEQAMFLGAGLFLWIVCLPGSGRASGQREAAGAFGLLFTSVHMTLLGALLALAPRPLFGEAAVTCFGTTLGAAEDQVLGGVIMLMIGAAVYLAGALFLMARLLRHDPAEAQRR